MKYVAGMGFVRLRLPTRIIDILEFFQEADGQAHQYRLSPVVERWVEEELARRPDLQAEFAERQARAQARVTPRVAAPPPASVAIPAAPRGTAPVTARVTAPVTGRVHPK